MERAVRLPLEARTTAWRDGALRSPEAGKRLFVFLDQAIIYALFAILVVYMPFARRFQAVPGRRPDMLVPRRPPVL